LVCGYCRARSSGFPRFQGEFPLHRSWGEPASAGFLKQNAGAAGYEDEIEQILPETQSEPGVQDGAAVAA